MKPHQRSNFGPKRLTAVVANQKGEIFELDGYAAVGMSGNQLIPLEKKQTASMPYGSEMMFLPQRVPLFYNVQKGKIESFSHNPYDTSEKIFPVAAFNSPGYIITHNCAYLDNPDARPLPLFSYGAVGWFDGGFRSAVLQVDPERRQDLRLMRPEKVLAGIERMRRKLPGNRLRRHLEGCALEYGCPAGKNFFLGRYEAPLPTAKVCNADCLGCLSLQKQEGLSCSQKRIAFTPTPEEIARVALVHINAVQNPIVSFGQGCEGDPLLADRVIVPAIKLIRKKTSKGTIHVNTNGSLPEVMKQCITAGLDSVRISINSFRERCYQAYFRPKGYGLKDVLGTIRISLEKGLFVSINYLNMPGFTDVPEEVESLEAFLNRYPIQRIQWRNLNYDPIRYRTAMQTVASCGEPKGIQQLLNQIRKTFPHLSYGYFNPPKEKW